MIKILTAIVFTAMFAIPAISQASDAALRRVIDADNAEKIRTGSLPVLSAAEHLSRAETYMANRLFPEARAHWAIVMEKYPTDAGIPKALFGTARSYMWEREYLTAVEWFDKLTKDHLNTKDGREGLAFKGASYVRAGKNLEAARTYEQYTVMFPEGEKIESAHLNIIDAYREAGEYDKANAWVDITTRKFPGKPTMANAVQARIRMEIYRGEWDAAVRAADSLLSFGNFRGSMTSADEIKYLKAFALEKAGKRAAADEVYNSIPNTITSYYGGLAAQRRSGPEVRTIASVTPRLYTEYPGPVPLAGDKARDKEQYRPAFCARHYETGERIPPDGKISGRRPRFDTACLRHGDQI
jgi:outer membrane protein assembly factor BamD (BamD/ComL family)